ncbi:hypothetical protein CRX72_21700 [Pantoea sp. BRM17]|nr:hypothetical protein CRX72_21700 [Pantoea sp. BRM17]
MQSERIKTLNRSALDLLEDDPEGLKRRIIAAALSVFAEYGLPGARMEQIAALAQTTKRMVVYHFTSKEALYIDVLEQVYRAMRESL